MPDPLWCVLLLIPSLALGDKPRITVTPFLGGPQARIAERVVMNSLRPRYELVPAADTTEERARGKRKAKVRRRKKGPITRRKRVRGAAAAAARIAALTPPLAEAVIGGAVVKRRRLLIAVKNSATGNTRRLSWPINGRLIPRSTFERIAAEVPPVVDEVVGRVVEPATTIDPLAGPGTEPLPTEGGGTTAAVPPPGAAASVPPAPAQLSTGPARPAWAPYLDLDGSFFLSARRFAFSQPGLPGFSSSVNGGVRVDGTLLPAASAASGDAGIGGRALAGVGVGVSGELVFRPDSSPSPCGSASVAGQCVEKYATSEYRVEGGLRWRWNITGRDDRPDLRLSVEYGVHHFGIARRTATRIDGSSYQADVGPPDADYRYVTMGLGTRIPFAGRMAASAQANYHALLDKGPIGSPSGYGTFGKGGGFGLRAQAGLELRLVAALYLGVSGFYERYGLSFAAAPPGTASMSGPPCGEPLPCATSGGATDEYYGGAATLGYRF